VMPTKLFIATSDSARPALKRPLLCCDMQLRSDRLIALDH
jgi:hypothetical protein